MPPANAIPASETEALHASLWHALGTATDDICIALSTNSSPQFIGALTQLALAQLGTAARDCEGFARHAGRTTIETADVVLLARRNEELEKLLRERVGEVRRAAAGN